MRKLAALMLAGIATCSVVNAQYFEDDFESYTVNSYLGPQSPTWTTWSGVDGGSDDVLVDNTDAHSGSKSLYFESSGGGGPHDVILDFGGLHTSGRFKYTMWMKIPSGKNAYFNFQGGSSWGSIWSAEIYWYSGGSWSVSGYGLNSNYPVGQWFELVVDCDLDAGVWEFFIDGVSKGTINNTNGVSYLDLFEASSSSEWWVDDVSYCVNNACNAELELSSLSVNPASVCTHHPADVSLNVKNNSSFTAPSFELGIDVGPNRITQTVNLNLAGGSSTTINLPGFFNSTVAGSNVSVKAINLSGDIEPNNDTSKTTVTVLPSPSQAYTTQGTPWMSTRPNTSGASNDKDIVTASETLTWDVIPPVGYANSGYNSTWDITNVSFYTQGGTAISGSLFNFTAPSGSNNGKISFTPDNSLIDSNVLFCFNINSLTNGCDSVLCRNIRVVPRPVAQWASNAVCDQDAMVLNNTSTIQSGYMDFLWDFGDGSTSNLENPTHTYATYGTYTVKLYATSDYGYVDSLVQTVTVNQLPTADFEVRNACEGTPLDFTDQSFLPSGTPDYEWDFGDGSAVNTTQNPSHLYTNPGLYTIEFTVTVNGCSDTRIKYGTQAHRAVPSFTSTTTCNNTNAVFDNTTMIAQGTFGSTWKFGDGNSITTKSPKHKYAGYGTFDVTLIVTTNLGCSDSVTQSVSLTESPRADFSQSSVCSEEEVNFTNLTNTPAGGSNDYMWDLGNGMTSQQPGPSTQYLAPGEYTVTLIAANTNGCSDTLVRNVKIDTKPIAIFAAEDVCDGETVDFKNNTINIPMGATYAWDFGNGVNSASTDTAFVYAGPGSYDVILLVSTPNGCLDTATKMLNVNPNPDGSFLFSSAEKGDGTITFTANAGSGNDYLWFMGDGNKYTVKDFSHKFEYSGNFEVKLVVTSDKGCVSETTQIISVFPDGINGPDRNALKVYPNPASTTVNLDLSDLNGPAQIRVMDAQGKTVLEKASTAAQEQLDLSTLADGNYMILVTVNDRQYSAKLQIQH